MEIKNIKNIFFNFQHFFQITSIFNFFIFLQKIVYFHLNYQNFQNFKKLINQSIKILFKKPHFTFSPFHFHLVLHFPFDSPLQTWFFQESLKFHHFSQMLSLNNFSSSCPFFSIFPKYSSIFTLCIFHPFFSYI